MKSFIIIFTLCSTFSLQGFANDSEEISVKQKRKLERQKEREERREKRRRREAERLAIQNGQTPSNGGASPSVCKQNEADKNGGSAGNAFYNSRAEALLAHGSAPSRMGPTTRPGETKLRKIYKVKVNETGTIVYMSDTDYKANVRTGHIQGKSSVLEIKTWDKDLYQIAVENYNLLKPLYDQKVYNDASAECRAEMDAKKT